MIWDIQQHGNSYPKINPADCDGMQQLQLHLQGSSMSHSINASTYIIFCQFFYIDNV